MRTTGASIELEDALAEAPFFSSLPPRERARLAASAKLVTMRAHERLWREGATPKGVGLVLAGRLAVERTRTRVVMVEIVGVGELVGEVSWVLGTPHQYDVRCLRHARVALIPGDVLSAGLARHPPAAGALTEFLSQRVLSLTRRLESLSSGSVERRLAGVLASLAERFGTPFPGGLLVPVRLRREDLAAMAATTLESTSRQLNRWSRQGLLVTQPVGLLLRDVQLLRSIAGTW